MVLNLSPELEQLIQQQVESGRFASPEAVIEQALRLLREYEGPISPVATDARGKNPLWPDPVFPNSEEECITAPCTLPTAFQFRKITPRQGTIPLPDPKIIMDEEE